MLQKGKRINEEIRASKLNVIDAQWEQLWIIPIEQALELAEKSWMDLVEISNQNWLILAKIMDYWKFIFKQQKNVSKSRWTSKKAELKTIRITYKMEKHDMEVKKNIATKFSKECRPLKVVLMLRWRENQYEKVALEKMKDFIALLEEIYKLEGNIAKTGNSFNVLLQPKK